MKEVPRTDWARRLLEDQIQRLGELRNASPRDPGFKLWRQTTLTVIQRIWPGDLARSERFRRVPFTTPSPKATRGQIKEHYERGCAEAAAYLRSLTLEIETSGLKAPGAPPSGPARLPADLAGSPPPAAAGGQASPKPFDPRDLFEPSPLERIKPTAADSGTESPAAAQADEPEPRPAPAVPPPARPAAPTARPQRPAEPPQARRHAPPAGPAQRSDAGGVPAKPRPAVPSTPAARSAAPAGPKPVGPMPPAEAPPRGPRSTDRQALKEMLGFVDEPGAVPSAPTPPPRPKVPPDADLTFTPPLPPPVFAGDHGEPSLEPPEELEEFTIEAVEVDDETIEAEPAESEIEAPEHDAAAGIGPAEEGDPDILSDDGDDHGDLAIEFLERPSGTREHPAPTVASADPRPGGSVAAPRVMAPAAAALTALAAEVARLDVPEGQRAGARAALLDLARQLDDETASWDSIREILWMVADYPALARRVIPLLVPYLDLR